MGQYLDLPAENAGLKEYYDGQKVENLAYDDNPLLTMMPKNTASTGKYFPVPVIYEVSQGRSTQFTNAQGNQTPMQLAEFLVTLKPDYAIATIGHQAALAAADDQGGFINFAKRFIDVAVQAAANSAASSLFRSGTGSIGQISGSVTAGGVITLSDASSVVQFGINQTLQANQTDGGAPRAALGYVIGRNVMAGTITVSATALGGPAGAPSGWSSGDFLLVQGDNNGKLSGLPAWLPTTAPSSTDNFFGVNRSVDSRLYGLAYPGVSQLVEEAFIDDAMLLQREKGKPKHIFTNFGSYAALIKALGARREFVDWKGPGEIGFTGVKMQGPNGVIEVYGDRNCPAQTAYLLQLDTWELQSLKPVPHIFNMLDGLDVLRVVNADAYEARVGYYANPTCRAPGWNSAMTLQV